MHSTNRPPTPGPQPAGCWRTSRADPDLNKEGNVLFNDMGGGGGLLFKNDTEIIHNVFGRVIN